VDGLANVRIVKGGDVTQRTNHFFEWSREQHTYCAIDTIAQTKNLDRRFTELRTQTASLLSLLFDFATCAWGCAARGHLIEGITGKCVSSARAAITLMDFGHYDEALALIRSIAEVANLFSCFIDDPDQYKSWIKSSREERLHKFSPVKIRLHIEKRGLPIPYDEKRYRILSEAGTHANPAVRPQTHNTQGLQTLGGIFQERGYVLCITELALSVAIVGATSVVIADLRQDKCDLINEKAFALWQEVLDSEVDPSPNG
jgi:uncharacterized protein DUF5677